MICSIFFLVLSLTGMTEGSGSDTPVEGMTEGGGSDTPVEVKFSYFIPYAAIELAGGKQGIIDGIIQFTPEYIPIKPQYINHVDIFSYNGMIGVEMVISSLAPNIFDVMFEAKTFVECGTVIETGDSRLPSIAVDPDFFEYEYSPGMDPILTGDETVICSTTEGPTTTATTTERKIITRRPTKKPTAGTRKTSGIKALVTLALLMVVMIVY